MSVAPVPSRDTFNQVAFALVLDTIAFVPNKATSILDAYTCRQTFTCPNRLSGSSVYGHTPSERCLDCVCPVHGHSQQNHAPVGLLYSSSGQYRVGLRRLRTRPTHPQTSLRGNANIDEQTINARMAGSLHPPLGNHIVARVGEKQAEVEEKAAGSRN